jgi:methylmalonyl-CoA mutase N-terminal domain/subunit
MVSVAARMGLTAEEYAAHLAAGQRWCTGCKKWEDESVFGRDKNRRSGRNARCRRAVAERDKRRTKAERERVVTRQVTEDALAELFDMLRARRPHREIYDHLVATVGRP